MGAQKDIFLLALGLYAHYYPAIMLIINQHFGRSCILKEDKRKLLLYRIYVAFILLFIRFDLMPIADIYSILKNFLNKEGESSSCDISESRI